MAFFNLWICVVNDLHINKQEVHIDSTLNGLSNALGLTSVPHSRENLRAINNVKHFGVLFIFSLRCVSLCGIFTTVQPNVTNGHCNEDFINVSCISNDFMVYILWVIKNSDFVPNTLIFSFLHK